MFDIFIKKDGNLHVDELRNNISSIIIMNSGSIERKFLQFSLDLINIDQFENLFIDSMKDDDGFKDIIVDFLNDKNVYVFCLQYQIFFISKKSLINFIKKQRSNFNENKIHFRSKAVIYQFIKDTSIKLERENYNSNFQKEITEFISNAFFNCDKNVLSHFLSIRNILIGFLIQKSYYNTKIRRNENHKTELIEDEIGDKIYDIENFITITNFISKNLVTLSYNITEEELYVIKRNEEENLRRERECFQRMTIQHRYRIKYLGDLKNKDGIVLEFINGESLDQCNLNELTFAEKISIMLNLMTSIEDIHLSKIIYRDLKPTNIIINECKEAVIIDFDFSRVENPDEQYTSDIGQPDFVSPEQNRSNKYTYKTDIFSIGKIINFIVTNKNENPSSFLNEFKYIKDIYDNCVAKDPSVRMRISKLINTFYETIFKNYNKELFYSSNENEVESNDKNRIKNSLIELAKIRIIRIQEFIKIDDQKHKETMITNIFDIFNFLNDFVYKDYDEKFSVILGIIEELAEQFPNEVDHLTLFYIGKAFAVKNDMNKAKHYFDLVEIKNIDFFKSNQFIHDFLQQKEDQSSESYQVNVEIHFHNSSQQNTELHHVNEEVHSHDSSQQNTELHHVNEEVHSHDSSQQNTESHQVNEEVHSHDSSQQSRELQGVNEEVLFHDPSQSRESHHVNEEGFFHDPGQQNTELHQSSSDSQISFQNQIDEQNDISSNKSYRPQVSSEPIAPQSFPIPELPQVQQSSSQSSFFPPQNRPQLLTLQPLLLQLKPIQHQSQSLLTELQPTSQFQASSQIEVSPVMLYPAIPPKVTQFESFDIEEPEL